MKKVVIFVSINSNGNIFLSSEMFSSKKFYMHCVLEFAEKIRKNVYKEKERDRN